MKTMWTKPFYNKITPRSNVDKNELVTQDAFDHFIDFSLDEFGEYLIANSISKPALA